MRGKPSYLTLRIYIMKIDIHELTAKEFDEAFEWYELQSKGLGKRFKNQ